MGKGLKLARPQLNASAIEIGIEDTWRELADLTNGATRRVWITRTGRVFASNNDPRSLYTREVGTYGRAAKLSELREDVFFVWDDWRKG